MKFGILATMAGLISGQEMFTPVTDELPGHCGITFKACDLDTSKFWKINMKGTTCDKDKYMPGDYVKINLSGMAADNLMIGERHIDFSKDGQHVLSITNTDPFKCAAGKCNMDIVFDIPKDAEAGTYSALALALDKNYDINMCFKMEYKGL